MALAGMHTAPDALPTSAQGRDPPDAAAIDPSRVVVSYDRPTDTLFIHLYGRGREAISEVAGDYWYTLVDLDSGSAYRSHCECTVRQGAKWWHAGGGESDCRRPIVAVVVVRVDSPIFRHPPEALERFRYVCGTHRDKHGVRPELVLGVVTLPPARMAEIRAEQARQRKIADERLRMAEEAERASEVLGGEQLFDLADHDVEAQAQLGDLVGVIRGHERL